jgi:predicted TIM-barrel fold metal-dependent hydrolase
MIIDFHTHIFPNELAPKALGSLLSKLNKDYIPANDCTLDGLKQNMKKWGIDISVIQPVITRKSQLKNINLWAKEITSGNIISFGGVYPHTDDYKSDIDFVVDLGLKGLKFHPEYQDFQVDDKDMLKMYDYALSKGLVLLFHAGVDIGMPAPYKSSPKQFANVVDAMQGGTIIAAHLGGHRQWDDVERYLVGKDIYLDTSMGLEYYSKEQFLRIVKNHSADKILFASDSPWSYAGKEIEIINELPLSSQDKNKIFSINARNILKI